MRVFLFLLSAFSCNLIAEELNILCWEGYAPEEHVQHFERFVQKKYGVELTINVSNISDPQTFFNKIRSKDADLISPSHTVPKSPKWRFIQKELLLPIDLDHVPNYQHIIEDLKQLDFVSSGAKIYGVPLLFGPYGLGYSVAEVSKAPKSWQALWSPEYKRKYAISADYYEANIYVTALALGYDKEQIFDYDLLSQDPAFQPKLNALAQNALFHWEGVDRVDEFESLQIATAWGFSFPELKQRGQDWQMAEPSEGTTGWVDFWAIGYSLKDKPLMKRIAEEWINYSLSPEMQVGYVRNIGQHPVNLTIKAQLNKQENARYHLEQPDYFKNNLILWQVLSAREHNGFLNMWQEAKQSRK